MIWKYKKTFAVISFFILIALYWNREFFISNFYWAVHSPKEFMGRMEPEYPSWYASRYSEWGKPDTNNNGIRDDVEIRLNIMMKDYTREEVSIMYKKVQLSQSSLGPIEDRNKFGDDYWRRMNTLWKCSVIYSGHHNLVTTGNSSFDTERFDQMLFVIYEKLMDILFNTERRRYDYEWFMGQFRGRSSSANEHVTFSALLRLEENCDFSKMKSNEIRDLYISNEIKKRPHYMNNRKGAIDEFENEYGTNFKYRYEKHPFLNK